MLNSCNYIKIIIYSAAVLGIASQLAACSPHSPNDGLAQSSLSKGASLPEHHHSEGQKLLDVAGKSTMPVQNPQSEVHYALNNDEKPMVGRYMVTISCQDQIARCDTEQQGSVDYIINLMDDGSVFRLIKSFGKVYADTRTTQDYHRDHWEVVTKDQKKYVLVHFNNGLKFYYCIDRKGNLTMDSQRNFAINRDIFAQGGHPYTLKDYYLERAKN